MLVVYDKAEKAKAKKKKKKAKKPKKEAPKAQNNNFVFEEIVDEDTKKEDEERKRKELEKQKLKFIAIHDEEVREKRATSQSKKTGFDDFNNLVDDDQHGGLRIRQITSQSKKGNDNRDSRANSKDNRQYGFDY